MTGLRQEGGPSDRDLNDLRRQIVELKKLGPVSDLIVRLPGLHRTGVDRGGFDFDRESRRILAMIDGMTILERSYPFLITLPGRCARIAEGAGVRPSDVAGLFAEFQAMSGVAMGLERGGWRQV